MGVYQECESPSRSGACEPLSTCQGLAFYLTGKVFRVTWLVQCFSGLYGSRAGGGFCFYRRPLWTRSRLDGRSRKSFFLVVPATVECFFERRLPVYGDSGGPSLSCFLGFAEDVSLSMPLQLLWLYWNKAGDIAFGVLLMSLLLIAGGRWQGGRLRCLGSGVSPVAAVQTVELTGCVDMARDICVGQLLGGASDKLSSPLPIRWTELHHLTLVYAWKDICICLGAEIDFIP